MMDSFNLVQRLDMRAELADDDSRKDDANDMREASIALAAKDAQIARLRKALEPLTRLEIPRNPHGNAGAYSIRHADIQAAKDALDKSATPTDAFVKWLEDGPRLAKAAGCHVGIKVTAA